VTYPEELLAASVVIVFCNEAPSAILRTIHSVVNRSPPQYLHEIVLLDDASDRRKLLLLVHFAHVNLVLMSWLMKFLSFQHSQIIHF
jgi:hypothetical protein